MKRASFQFKAGLLVLVALCGPAFAAGEDDARHWLKRMAAAMNHLSYQGTFVYVRGEAMETMRITHVVDEKGHRERLYSVTGPHREVIRDEQGVRCVLGDDKAIVEDPVVSGAIFPEIPLADLDSDDSSYQFRAGGTDRIAGHNGLRITIAPGDKYRYGYDLWLEEHTGLLLKWVLFDDEDKALAKLEFTDIRFGSDIDKREMSSSTPSGQFTYIDSGIPKRQVISGDRPEWQPGTLPRGFKLAAHSHHQHAGENLFEHLVYSDGLASVSVYIEQRPDDVKGVNGFSRIGTANAFSRSLGSRQVTVIGQVPVATVRAIGDAFSDSANQR